MDKVISAKQLRERIRSLVRDLGVLEKSEALYCGVTFAQCHAIVEIGRKGEISLSELAELLRLDSSTMSRTVNNLVKQGLVERELSPEDRRYVRIKLTEEGQKVFKRTEDSMGEYYTKLFAEIPNAKKDMVIESLQLLLEALKKINSRAV